MRLKTKGGLEFIFLIVLITSITPLSLDALLPALTAIGTSLCVKDSNELQLIISMFVFGMVFGELIFGPLSDAIGRKIAILIGIIIYCGGTICAMEAQSMSQMLLGRVIQGIGVSGPKIASRAMIRDKFEGNKMARVLSFILIFFILVPMFAPAIGQGILFIADWQAIFIFFLFIAGSSTSWLFLRQPETLAPSLRRPLALKSLLEASGLIVRHTRVMACTAIAGLIFSILLVYISTSPSMFQHMYDKGNSFSFYYAILASGFGFAALLNSHFVMRYGMHRLMFWGIIGLIALGFYLLFGVVMYSGVPPFLYFMIGCFCLLFCLGILFSNVNAMAMQSLGKIAGLGTSITSAFSSIIAVVISMIIGSFYNDTLYPLTIGILSCSVISLQLLRLAHRSSQEEVIPRERK